MVADTSIQSPSRGVALLLSKRILVLGSSGAGKTTFATRLARILNIPLIHLDAQFWQPGWRNTPQSEWRTTVTSLIQADSWIMDGTYESSLDLRIPAADAVVLIERSRWSCLWRVIKRKATTDDLRRPDAPPGQKLDLAFFRYVWQYPRVSRPIVLESIRRYGEGKTLIELHGAQEVAAILQEVERAAGGSS